MINDSPSDRVLQLLESGEVQAAARAAIEHLPELTGERRTVSRVLDALYREEDDAGLTALICGLRELEAMPREILTFTLRMAFRGRRYDEALASVEALLQVSDDDVEALRTGGRIGNILEDDDLALRYWERLARTTLGDAEAPLQTARIRMRRGEFAGALDWALRASQLQAAPAEALLIAVRAGLAVGWTPACDDLLVRLFALDGERALAVLRRLEVGHDCETFARVLSALTRHYPGQAELHDTAERVYPQWLSTAYEHEVGCRDLEAAARYRSAHALRPERNDGRRGIDRLLRYCLIAMRDAVQAQDFDALIEHGGMATSIDPACFEAWQMTGRAYFHRGDLAKAAGAFARCVELQPEDLPSWLDYGRVLQRLNDAAGALAALERVQSLAVGEEDAEIVREVRATIAALYPVLLEDARNAAADRDIARAVALCRTAQRIDANGAELQHIRRTLMRDLREQIAQLWKAQSDAVVECCRLFLELSAADPWALTVLGRTLMRLRRYPEALPVWERLTAQHPDDAHLHLQVARCCRALKLRERGLTAAREALRQDQLQEAGELVEFLEKLPPAPEPGRAPSERWDRSHDVRNSRDLVA